MDLDLTLSLSSIAATGVKTPFGPELISNGTFDTNTTGWTASGATLTVVSGAMRVTNSAGASGYGYQAVTTVIGATYQIAGTLTNGTSGARLRVGTTAGGSEILLLSASTPGTTFVATATTTYISCRNASATSGQASDYDNISLKKVL